MLREMRLTKGEEKIRVKHKYKRFAVFSLELVDGRNLAVTTDEERVLEEG